MKIIYYKCPDCGKMIELPATVRGRIVCAYCGSSGWIDDDNGNPVIRQDGPSIPERKTAQKEKKSFNPLIFVGVAAVIGVLYIIGTKPAETHQIAPPGATVQAEDPKEVLRAELKEKYDIIKPSEVRGDKTGKWRLNIIAITTAPNEFAVDYANAYMSEGDVHFIINKHYKTTTKLRLQTGILEVKTTEYVDKEERDARTLGNGYDLGEQYFDMATGKEIKAEVNENAGTVEAEELIEAVKEVADGGIGEGESITGIEFDGSDLRIIVDLSEADKTFPVEDLALSRISSITDEVLSLEDKYYNTWETVTVDFGPVGKATLDKSIVKDQGAGKFFDFDYDTVLKK